jgi:uncharacterized protein
MAERKIFNYIIYHGGCLDGFSGFFVAYISGRLSRNVFIYEDTPTTTKVPPNIDNKDIIIIDVAYKKEVLERIFRHAKSVVFIDHHISIKNDVNDLHRKYNTSNNIKIIYDDTKCGSTLAWSYFFERQKVPLFLKYVEDQDTGKWEDDKTKPFIFALKVYYRLNTDGKSLNKWQKLLDKETVGKLIKKGKYMKRYNDYIVKVNIPKHTMERFPSKRIYDMNPNIFDNPGMYKVIVFCGHNCPSITELANGALEKIPIADFCIMWVYNLDSKKYVLSMRSRKVDVSIICQLFGGGGHKLAAACSIQSSTMKIEDLFEGPKLITKNE